MKRVLRQKCGLQRMAGSCRRRRALSEMSRESKAREAYYSAGRMFGSASFVAHSKVERADIVNGDLEVYLHRMGLLAQAKSSSEDDLDAYRKMLNQSEGGRAVLESFLMIWPTIKEAAEAMIETGDLSGKQFSAALQFVEQGLSPTLRYIAE